MFKIRSIALAAVATIALAGAWAPAGSAVPLNTKNWVGTPNGLVGVQQTVTVRAPRLAGEVVTITFTNPQTQPNSGQAAVDSAGFASLPWTPTLPGTWTITANGGGLSIDPATIVVSAMPTVTTLFMPGEVEPNRSTSILAQVKALSGILAPSGTISVTNQFGAQVASGTLQPTATQGLSSASMNWTPAPGSFVFTATYTPNSTAFTASTSPSQTPYIGNAQPISLSLPPVMYVGVPARVSGIINPQFLTAQGGSVAFFLQTQGVTTYPMGGTLPIANGVGTTTWTPSQAGVQTVGVDYSTVGSVYSGLDTQVVNVQPAPTPDVVTVTPSGSPAWGPGAVGALTAGSSVELTPSSTSGNPVTFDLTGPCAMEAGTLTVLGPGQCVVTANSIGNGGSLSASQSSYVIQVQAAPRKKKR